VVSERRCYSSPTAWLGIAAVLGVVWLPPEHVHEMDGHGEHTEIVHRHLAFHHQAEPGGAVDHQDGEEHDLISPFVVPGTPGPVSFSAFVFWLLPSIDPPAQRGWMLESLHIRVHDPPWAASVGLRGPPPARHTLI